MPEAVDGLRRRSLVERGQRPGSFTLHSVVLEYMTAVLIAEAASEIEQGRLSRLSDTHIQTLPHPDPVQVVSWSPDGRLLAGGDLEGCIRLWEIQKTQPATGVQTPVRHTSWVLGLAFAPDSRTLASASWDGTVKF